MPKARTRSGPQWRTAPGLHTSSSEAPEPPTPSVDRDAAPHRFAPPRTRPTAAPDAAPSAPAPGPNREDRAGRRGVDAELYTHAEPGDGDSTTGPEVRAAAGSEVRAAAGLSSPLRRRVRCERQAVADGPQPAGGDPGPELAAPQAQVQLDTELPQRPRGDSRGSLNGSRLRPSGGAVVARYVATEEMFSRSVRSLEPISDLEAAAFAGRFAADFQSFDQDRPSRRAEVLRPLLADPQACAWGWSGEGRQRADSPQPNRIYRRSDVVVFVEVIVRVTPYARACPSPDPSEASAEPVEPPGVLGPSSAPSPSDPNWVAGGSSWVRMTVPITRSADDGRLVVDPHLVPDPSA